MALQQMNQSGPTPAQIQASKEGTLTNLAATNRLNNLTNQLGTTTPEFMNATFAGADPNLQSQTLQQLGSLRGQVGSEANTLRDQLGAFQTSLGTLPGQYGQVGTDLTNRLAGVQSGYADVGNILSDSLIGPNGARQDLQMVRDPITGEFNAAKAGVAGQTGALGNLANIMEGRATGVDPAFETFRQMRMTGLEDAQQRQLGQQGEFFARRGLAGSSSALNAQNRLGDQFTQQSGDLASQLGLQQLQRGDTNLMNAAQLRQAAAGLYGQQAGLTGQQAQLQAGLIGQQSGLDTTNAHMQAQLLGQQGQLGLAEAQQQQSLLGSQQGVYQQQLANALAGNQAQNAASQLQAQLSGQQFGTQATAAQMANQAQEMRLNSLTAGLQNLAAPAALSIAQLAAENAGKGNSASSFQWGPMLPTSGGTRNNVNAFPDYNSR